MSEREKGELKSVENKNWRVVKRKGKTFLRTVDEMQEMNVTMEEQQILEIERESAKDEEEEREAAMRAQKREEFIHTLNKVAEQFDLGGFTGTGELYDQMKAKKEQGERPNIAKCYSDALDVSDDEESPHKQPNKKRLRMGIANSSNTKVIGSQANNAMMSERERAALARKAMFQAPAREEMRARTAVQRIVRPAKETNNQNGKETNATTESNRTMKGRIKVYQLEADKVLKALEEKNLRVNMKMARDGNTMMQCEAAQRLDVIKVLKENGQTGHSFMTREDRYEVRLLKNVDYSFGPARIKAEIEERLKEMGGEVKDLRVDRFETFHSISNQKKYHMYVVKAEDVDTMNMITAIKGICNTIVTWDRMRKHDVTQCFNCYEHGHSQMGGCFKPRRCKRCLEIGSEHVCTVEPVEPTAENGYNIYEKYQCCMCLGMGHPPTYTKCPKFAEKIEQARKAKEMKNESRWQRSQLNSNDQYRPAQEPTQNAWAQGRNKRPGPGGERQTIEHVNQPQARQTQRVTGSEGIDLETEIKRVLGIDVEKLQRLALDFMAKYRTKKTKEEQGALLALYYLEVNGFQP